MAQSREGIRPCSRVMIAFTPRRHKRDFDNAC
jgi:hypothetical protein